MKTRLRLKLVAAIGAVAVAIALLFVAADPSATGYEISVYDSYPAAFWLLLLCALFLGQIVVFESAERDGRHSYWKLGFGLMLAVNAVILFVQAIRYDLYLRGDMLTFVGMIRHIQDLGIVPETNYYPNAHLLALAVSYATGVDPAHIVNYLPPLASLLYIVALYYLLTAFFENEAKILFVLPFSSLLLLKGEHVLFTPSVLAFTMIPFMFYLLFRIYTTEANTRFKVLFVVAVISLVFYHPAVTVFFTGMLILLKLTFVVMNVSATGAWRENTSLISASIAFVLFFSWYYSFSSIIGSTIAIVYTVLGVAEGTSTFEQVTSVFSRASPDLYDVLLVGIYSYGLIAAITGMVLVFVGCLGYLSLRGRRLDAVEVFLSATFFAFLAASVVAFFVNVTLGFTRFARYVRFTGAILIGVGFFALFRRTSPEAVARYLRPLVYVSFIVFGTLSMFMVYGSPISNERNQQVTKGEVEGMQWLFSHRNPSLLIDELGISQYRHYTFEFSSERWGTTIRIDARPPDHFTYGNESQLDEPEFPRYLLISKYGRIKNQRFYPEYRPYWRHTPEDFRQLEYNSTFSHVYDGGGLDVYVVSNRVDASNETAG